MTWSVVKHYVLDGTYLELTPQYGSSLYYVGDWRDRENSLTGALPLKTAKRSAEHICATNPNKYIQKG